jgi:hypothetical protein
VSIKILVIFDDIAFGLLCWAGRLSDAVCFISRRLSTNVPWIKLLSTWTVHSRTSVACS